MTDFKQEIKSYSPIDLDRLLKTNLDMPDNLKNSVLLYNKALDNIRIKSEDIAIIELKKAISLNSDFCEAINLLGLLYASVNEINMAKGCFERVLGIDAADKKALEYINLIDPNYNCTGNTKAKTKEKKEAKEIKEIKKSPAKVQKKNPKKEPVSKDALNSIADILKMDAVKYLIGFAVGLLVFFLVSNIVNLGKSEPDVPVIVDNLHVNDPDGKDKTVDYESEYNKLVAENDSLKTQLEDLKKTAQNYNNISQLLTIDKQVSAGNFVGAADMLVAFKEVELTELEKEKYESLKTKTMEKAAQQLYNEAREQYKNKQFGEALEKFDKVMTYVDEWKYSMQTIYYIGVCHQELNNKDKALEAFNKVIAQYPSSSFAGYAKSRLDSLSPGT